MSEDKAQGYTEMLSLFNELKKWNDYFKSENADTMLVACQQLLINYNDQVIQFLNDETENKSLLKYLAGDDGLEQWNFYKGFYQNYDVHIF